MSFSDDDLLVIYGLEHEFDDELPSCSSYRLKDLWWQLASGFGALASIATVLHDQRPLIPPHFL